MESEFPALALGTLVENAVKYGIAPKPDGGVITIAACRTGDDLEVAVRDTGVGFAGKQGSGIGLVNVRTGLKIQYGDRGRLELAGILPTGMCATIRIPCRPMTEPA